MVSETAMREDKAFQQRIERIEGLIARVDASADPNLRAAAKELLQATLQFHGTGLARIMEFVSQAGDAGNHLLERFSRDDLISGLLLLHGLHPQDMETRVKQAIERIGASLRLHGSEVDLIGVADGVVRVRIRGGSAGCGAPAAKPAVESAIYEAAPDLNGIIVEDMTEPPSPAFVPLAKLLGRDNSVAAPELQS